MTSNKSSITANLNSKVIEKLEPYAIKKEMSMVVDEILSRKLGITYEEAYPDDVGKKRKWIGVFR